MAPARTGSWYHEPTPMGDFQVTFQVLFASACFFCGCWSTEGPGPGPYSHCEQPDDCTAVGEVICLQRRTPVFAEEGGESIGSETTPGLEPLFCSHACTRDDPRSCPLGKFDPELTPACLAILNSAVTYCALVTESSCPDGMLQFTVDDRTVCVFAE